MKIKTQIILYKDYLESILNVSSIIELVDNKYKIFIYSDVYER